MYWLLVVTYMSINQSAIETIPFADHTSCTQAGIKITEVLAESAAFSNKSLIVKCVKVSGLK